MLELTQKKSHGPNLNLRKTLNFYSGDEKWVPWQQNGAYLI